MKRETQKKIILVLAALIVLTPLFVLAQSPLVTCGRSENFSGTAWDDTKPCTLCHLFILGQRVLNFLMWIAAPVIAILVFAWGGFKILISGPNPGLRQDGFRIIKNALWGLLIIFGAWAIINTLLLAFGNVGGVGSVTGVLPWNKIQCQ